MIIMMITVNVLNVKFVSLLFLCILNAIYTKRTVQLY